MSESNDRRIDDATPDTDVTGVEKIPVSDGGTPKFATIEQIKNFVATEFAALQNAANVSVNSDGVYLKKDGELKPVAANVFADAIISFMFGKNAETGLQKTDEIVISRDGDVKKTTVGDIAEIVKEIVNPPNMDIGSLDEIGSGISNNPYIAISQNVSDESGESKTYKVDFNTFFGLVLDKIISSGSVVEEVNPHNDMLFGHKFNDETRTMDPAQFPIDRLPFGDGDVKGPSANTDGKIPQWNGANSKTLKDGLNVATSITSGSGSNEVPTAVAVYNSVKDKINAPSSNTDGNIPRWDGANSKTLKDGLGFSTSMGDTPSNAKVLSEKAVSDAIADAFTSALASGGSIPQAISSAITAALTATGAIGSALAGKVGAPSYSTQDYIPQWDSTSKTLKNGKQVVTEIGTSASNEQVPTALAVKNAITGTDTSNLVKAPYSTTQYKVPRWSSTQRTLEDGLAVTDSAPSNGSSNEIPTTNAMIQSRGIMNTVRNPPADGTSGFKQYAFVLCNNSRNRGIYVNVGNESSSTWIKFAPVS